MAYLGHGRHLPIQVCARDPQGEYVPKIAWRVIRIDGYGYGDPVSGRRLYFGHPGRLEAFYLTDESRKVRNVKDKLIEERYVDLAEKRGIYSGHKVFQILASTSEVEAGEGGKEVTCYLGVSLSLTITT